MTNLSELRKKYKEMGEEIERLEKEEKNPVMGGIKRPIKEYPYDIYLMGPTQKFLGAFRKKEHAELRIKLIKALCPTDIWIPEVGEKFWVWDRNAANSYSWYNNYADKRMLAQGNVHKTSETAQAYGAVLTEWAELMINGK